MQGIAGVESGGKRHQAWHIYAGELRRGYRAVTKLWPLAFKLGASKERTLEP
jgi:hypothetical protein